MDAKLNQFEIVFSNEQVHQIISDFIKREYGFGIVGKPRIAIDLSPAAHSRVMYAGENDEGFVVRVTVDRFDESSKITNDAN